MVGSRQCCDSHRLTSRHDGGRRSAILARDRIVENLKGHGPTPRRIPLGVASRPYSLNWGPTNKGARLLTSALCARCDEAHNAGRRFAKLDWGGAKFSFVACASDRSRHGMRYASKARRVVFINAGVVNIREIAGTNAIRAWFSRRQSEAGTKPPPKSSNAEHAEKIRVAPKHCLAENQKYWYHQSKVAKT
jgi:hypothetical protein